MNVKRKYQFTLCMLFDIWSMIENCFYCLDIHWMRKTCICLLLNHRKIAVSLFDTVQLFRGNLHDEALWNKIRRYIRLEKFYTNILILSTSFCSYSDDTFSQLCYCEVLTSTKNQLYSFSIDKSLYIKKHDYLIRTKI